MVQAGAPFFAPCRPSQRTRRFLAAVGTHTGGWRDDRSAVRKLSQTAQRPGRRPDTRDAGPVFSCPRTHTGGRVNISPPSRPSRPGMTRTGQRRPVRVMHCPGRMTGACVNAAGRRRFPSPPAGTMAGERRFLFSAALTPPAHYGTGPARRRVRPHTTPVTPSPARHSMPRRLADPPVR